MKQQTKSIKIIFNKFKQSNTYKKNNCILKICNKKPEECKTINLYCQDESRFGMFTRNGKGLMAQGVKPVCTF